MCENEKQQKSNNRVRSKPEILKRTRVGSVAAAEPRSWRPAGVRSAVMPRSGLSPRTWSSRTPVLLRGSRNAGTNAAAPSSPTMRTTLHSGVLRASGSTSTCGCANVPIQRAAAAASASRRRRSSFRFFRNILVNERKKEKKGKKKGKTVSQSSASEKEGKGRGRNDDNTLLLLLLLLHW